MDEMRENWWAYGAIGGAFGLAMFLGDQTSPWMAFPIVGLFATVVLGLRTAFLWLRDVFIALSDPQ